MRDSYQPQFSTEDLQPRSRFRFPWRRMFDGCLGTVIAALIGLVGILYAQSHGSQIATSSGPANSAGGVSTVVSATATLAPTIVVPAGWNVTSQSGLPASGTSYSVNLQAGQLLMLTGGQFQVGSTFCNGGQTSTHICVLIYQATTAEAVTVTALIPGNNWVGISDSLTPSAALQIQEPDFWSPPNCQNGCANAFVYSFTDGQYTGEQTLSSGG